MLRIRETAQGNVQASHLCRNERINDLAQWLIRTAIHQLHSLSGSSSQNYGRGPHNTTIAQTHSLDSTILVFDGLDTYTIYYAGSGPLCLLAQPIYQRLPTA